MSGFAGTSPTAGCASFCPIAAPVTARHCPGSPLPRRALYPARPVNATHGQFNTSQYAPTPLAASSAAPRRHSFDVAAVRHSSGDFADARRLELSLAAPAAWARRRAAAAAAEPGEQAESGGSRRGTGSEGARSVSEDEMMSDRAPLEADDNDSDSSESDSSSSSGSDSDSSSDSSDSECEGREGAQGAGGGGKQHGSVVVIDLQSAEDDGLAGLGELLL